MADRDSGEEKLIWPTHRKLERLRRDGMVPRSKDFQSAFAILAIVIYLLFAWDGMSRHVRAAFAMVNPAMPLGFQNELSRAVSGMFYISADILLPVFAVGIGGGLLGAIFDAKGFPVMAKALAPDFSRINPAQGFKNLFSVKSLVEFGKGLAVISLVIGGNVLLFRTYYNDIMWAPSCGAACVTKVFIYVIGGSVAIGLLILMIEAVLDIPISRWQFMREQRMSVSELKREQREEFGDPQIRQERRRQLLQQARASEHIGLHRAQMVLSFGDSAVALTYVRGRTEAPIIAARTRTDGIEMVRRAAEMHLPIMEEPELVVRILESAGVGDFVPSNTFNDVARALVTAGVIR